MPWKRALSSALPARSVRTTRYGMPVASMASIAGVVGSMRVRRLRLGGLLRRRILERDADALVDAALALVAGDPDRPDLAGVRHVGPAIGLEVEPDDLDGPDLLDPLGQQVDLGPDEVRDGERLGAREDVDPDVARGGQLGVDAGLDGVDEVARHPLELEVHPSRARLHVAARHERAIVAPDDSAQRVQRRVGAHQRMPARPIEVHPNDVSDGRRGILPGLELMDDLAAVLAGRADRPRPPVGRAQQQAAIRWLATASRVEDRPVEHDEGRLAAGDRGDAGLDLAGVGVRVAELLAGRRHGREPITGR